MNGEDVKNHFQRRVNEISNPYNINQGIKGAINGILTKACGGDESRKLVLKYLCGVTTSRMLSSEQWTVLSEMVKPEKPSGMSWTAGNAKFQRAIDAVLAELKQC